MKVSAAQGWYSDEIILFEAEKQFMSTVLNITERYTNGLSTPRQAVNEIALSLQQMWTRRGA